MTVTPKIDLWRYDDLTNRLAVVDTDGVVVAGDASDLEFTSDGVEKMNPGESECARISGLVEVFGPRSIGDGAGPSMGLVLVGPGLVIITTQRLIVMCQGEKTLSQLGQGRANHVHLIVLPWELFDSLSMPAKKKFADRVAGNRAITLFTSVIMGAVKINPHQREVDGTGVRLTDDQAFALMAQVGATSRKPTAPASDQPRLDQILAGIYTTEDGELVASLTDPNATGLPPHLEGRLVERDGLEHPGAAGSASLQREEAGPVSSSHRAAAAAAPSDRDADSPTSTSAPTSTTCVCGKVLRTGAAFCTSCGRPVPPPVEVCGGCGTAFDDDDRYCTQCGVPRTPA